LESRSHLEVVGDEMVDRTADENKYKFRFGHRLNRRDYTKVVTARRPSQISCGCSGGRRSWVI
jgi:hypothetical protein